MLKEPPFNPPLLSYTLFPPHIYIEGGKRDNTTGIIRKGYNGDIKGDNQRGYERGYE